MKIYSLPLNKVGKAFIEKPMVSSKYTYFFMTCGRKIASVKNLKEYENILSSDIFLGYMQ